MKARWLDVSARGKIRVTGEDRARLLHAMSTNHIQQLQPGEGCYAFFLSAQGRILADANIFCRPDHLLLDTEPEVRGKLFEHIDKYIIADDAYVQDVTDELRTIALDGPDAAALLEKLAAPVPPAPYANADWGSRLVARPDFTGLTGFFLMAPAAEGEALIRQLEAAGASPATAEEFRLSQIENGKPRYGEDLSERFLAQEANQPHALHFSKGCYLGQEIVERVRSRGQIHRVLMPLEIDTATPPPPKTKLQADGKDVAEITSSAFSPARGKVVALAYVRTDLARPGAAMTLGDARAVVKTPACESHSAV